MYEKKKLIEICDIRIVVTAFVCLTIFGIFPQLNQIAVSAAALATIIFCSIDNRKNSFRAALMRMETITIGILIGFVVVWIDEIMQNSILFVGLSALGMLSVLGVCWLLKLPYIQAKIGCVIYVLIIVVMQGQFRITYGIMFFVGSLIGACITVLVASVFDLIERK